MIWVDFPELGLSSHDFSISGQIFFLSCDIFQNVQSNVIFLIQGRVFQNPLTSFTALQNSLYPASFFCLWRNCSESDQNFLGRPENFKHLISFLCLARFLSPHFVPNFSGLGKNFCIFGEVFGIWLDFSGLGIYFLYLSNFFWRVWSKFLMAPTRYLL